MSTFGTLSFEYFTNKRIGVIRAFLVSFVDGVLAEAERQAEDRQ
jgi:hypothetical protein